MSDVYGVIAFGIDLGSYYENDDYPQSLRGEEDHWDAIDIVDCIVEKEAGFESYKIGESQEQFKLRIEAMKKSPVELVCYGSMEGYPSFILAVRGTSKSAESDQPARGFELREVTQDQIEAMKNWCGNHDIKWSEPKWLLCGSN